MVLVLSEPGLGAAMAEVVPAAMLLFYFHETREPRGLHQGIPCRDFLIHLRKCILSARLLC